MKNKGDTKMGDTVKISKEGSFLSPTKNIAKIVLNRPDALNAFSPELLEDLWAAFEQVEKDDEIRAIIITAEGEKAFSAGADLKFASTSSYEEVEKLIRRGQEVFRRIEECPKPVIAAINGFALGGGLELALSCDVRIAADHVKLGAPEVSLGLIPGWGGTERLPRIVGLGRAKELALMGQQITAQEALEMGLVNKVVPKDELQSTAIFMATKMANNAPLAVQAAKRLVNKALDRSVKEGNEEAAVEIMKLFETEDLKEGVKAVFEKRQPKFQGK